MTIFLHIGFSKTGTTTIQTSMSVNAERLDREHRIYYPRTMGNHRLLAASFLYGDRYLPLENFVLNRLGTEEDARKTGEALRAEIARAARSSKAIVISAEQFQHLSEGTLMRLKEFLVNLNHPVKVVVYVRHPLERLSSDIVQRIRGGRQRLESYVPIDSVTPVLRRYVDAFGRDSIVVRRFGRQYFTNGSLIDDFIGTIAGRPIVGLEDVGERNPSLSGAAMLLADQINLVSPLQGGQRGNVAYLHRIGGPPFRTTRAMAERTMAVYADCMEYLAGTFDVRFDAVDPGVFPEDLPNTLSESAIRDIAIILNEQSLQIESLQRKLATAPAARKPLFRRLRRFLATRRQTAKQPV